MQVRIGKRWYGDASYVVLENVTRIEPGESSIPPDIRLRKPDARGDVIWPASGIETIETAPDGEHFPAGEPVEVDYATRDPPAELPIDDREVVEA